jgi:hypothetical protein
MAAGDRSLSDVLQDIIRNVQEIVRSEVRLAKTEIREEAAKGEIVDAVARHRRGNRYFRNCVSAAHDCLRIGSRHA